VGSCSKIWELGKEQSIIVSRMLKAEAENNTPTKPFNLAQILSETFTAQAKAQQTRVPGDVVDLSQLNEAVGTSIMHQHWSRDELQSLGGQLGETSTTLKTSGGDFNMRKQPGDTRFKHNHLSSLSSKSSRDPIEPVLRIGTDHQAELAQAFQNSEDGFGVFKDFDDDSGLAKALLNSKHDIGVSKYSSPSASPVTTSSASKSKGSSGGIDKKKIADDLEDCCSAIGTQIDAQYPDAPDQKKRKKEFRRNVKTTLMASLHMGEERAIIVQDSVQSASCVTPPVKKLERLTAGANAVNTMSANNNHSAPTVYADDILSPS